MFEPTVLLIDGIRTRVVIFHHSSRTQVLTSLVFGVVQMTTKRWTSDKNIWVLYRFQVTQGLCAICLQHKKLFMLIHRVSLARQVFIMQHYLTLRSKLSQTLQFSITHLFCPLLCAKCFPIIVLSLSGPFIVFWTNF